MAAPRNAIIGAAAAAIAGAVALGVMRDSPPPVQRECYRALAVMPCATAKSLAADASDVDCVDGEVTASIEIVADKDAPDGPQGATPAGADVLGDSLEPIPCASARRTDRAATTVALPDRGAEACIAGLVSRDVSAAGDGSHWRTWSTPYVCCGSRCRCDSAPCVRVPEHEFAGRETWRARLKERRPDLVPSGEGP